MVVGDLLGMSAAYPLTDLVASDRTLVFAIGNEKPSAIRQSIKLWGEKKAPKG